MATSSLHSSRLSAFLVAAPSVMPVHSGMLSSHLFFCLPLLLPPCTVPCWITCRHQFEHVLIGSGCLLKSEVDGYNLAYKGIGDYNISNLMVFYDFVSQRVGVSFAASLQPGPFMLIVYLFVSYM